MSLLKRALFSLINVLVFIILYYMCVNMYVCGLEYIINKNAGVIILIHFEKAIKNEIFSIKKRAT